MSTTPLPTIDIAAAISTIDGISGFSDDSTMAGEAWGLILAHIQAQAERIAGLEAWQKAAEAEADAIAESYDMLKGAWATDLAKLKKAQARIEKLEWLVEVLDCKPPILAYARSLSDGSLHTIGGQHARDEHAAMLQAARAAVHEE